MTDFDHAAIDEILASRVRLAIIAFLAGAKTADFVAVRDATKTTDGNASIHLRKLEDAGYVEMQKRFVARKPQTLYSLTERGRKALLDYVAHLEALLPPAAAPQGDGAGRRAPVRRATKRLRPSAATPAASARRWRKSRSP